MKEYLESDEAPRLHHKDELRHRIERARKDREGLRIALDGMIDPLDPSQIDQHREIVNIYTGEHSEGNCTLHIAVEIGTEQFIEYEAAMPDGFYHVVSKKVKPMQTKAPEKINCELIFSRILGLISSGRDLEDGTGKKCVKPINTLLKDELAPVPLALFTDDSLPRSTAKAELKKKLIAEDSSRQKADIMITDGSAVLRTLPWPGKGGLVSDFINTVREHIRCLLLEYSEVYFIFDRYLEPSIKDQERLSRGKGVTRNFVLRPGVEIPAQSTVLSVTKNKIQLINLIVTSLTENPILSRNILILTGLEETPYMIQGGEVIPFVPLRTSHEEADVIIVNQLLWAVKDNHSARVLVVCDDTDVMILLLYYYSKEELTCTLLMKGPTRDRKVINIKNAALKARNELKINPEDLLSLHALSGNDTVASCSGIGKVTALNVLKKGHHLDFDLVGDLTRDFEEVYKLAVKFFSYCYGIKPEEGETSIIPARIAVWHRKLSSSTQANPSLHQIPPTDNSLRANIRRAHYQAAIWRSCRSQHPPNQSPVEFGWYISDDGHMLPRMFDGEPNIAPEYVLKMIKCQCKAEVGRCTKGRCSCKEANMLCTQFCGCSRDGVRCGRYQPENQADPDEFTETGLESDDESNSTQF